MAKKKHAPNVPLPDSTELMGYKIVKVIARGSSCFIYLAKNNQEQLVAIKEYIPQKMPLREQVQLNLAIPPEHVSQFRQNLKTFFAEYRTLSCVAHPRIVRVLDFFRAHNTFYMVTNYEPGCSLRDFINRRLDKKMGYKTGSLIHACLRYRRHKKRIIGSRQIMEEHLVKKIFFQVVDGLKVVHAQELLYLDLKPENIYLHRDRTPFLLDFGATRRTVEKTKKKLNWVYTPGYAAPELLQKQRMSMGPWTDAYGIGATIFACMCGYVPQSADQRAIKDTMPQAFKALRKLYSCDLLDLVEWCLQLDREKRPQTMSILQEALLACQYAPPNLPRSKLSRSFLNRLRAKIKITSHSKGVADFI